MENIPTPPFPAYVRKETDAIKTYKDYGEEEDIPEIRGPMPMPWRLRVCGAARQHSRPVL